MKFKLYHYWRSTSSWRVRWALGIKRLECEFVAINLLKNESESPEHLARNPMGYIPVLEVNDPSRNQPNYLSESMAIIHWLDEKYPTPSLLPGDLYQRAHIRQLAELINAGTQPLQNLGVADLHSPDPEKQKEWNAHWIRKGLSAYETLVQAKAGRYSVGDVITLADLYLAPQCYNAGRFNVSLSEFPTVQRIYEALQQTPYYTEAAPERFEPK